VTPADSQQSRPPTELVDLGKVFGVATTDAAERQSLLDDPIEHLRAAGLVIPNWLDVLVVERDSPSLTITLAPLLDEGEIAEVFLNSANGGSFPPWL
jgi:hypothetical protein